MDIRVDPNNDEVLDLINDFNSRWMDFVHRLAMAKTEAEAHMVWLEIEDYNNRIQALSEESLNGKQG